MWIIHLRIFISIYRLLRATISNHQWVVVAKQLMIVDSTIGHSHVRCVMVSIDVLVLHRWGRCVYHMVLGLLDVCASLLTVIVVLRWTWSAISMVRSLHHIFSATMILISIIGETLWWVLVLSLWMILMMTSSAPCCHRLIYSTTALRDMTWMNMLWCGSWSIRTTRYSTWIYVVRAMHFLLASWSTMVSWPRMSNSWWCCFCVATRGLSVSRTIYCLILLSWKLTCFRISIIIESYVWFILMAKSRRVTVRFSIHLIILIFRHQIIVAWRIASTI